MSKDIIPVIYSLRAKINDSRPLDEQVDTIATSLLHLDRVYGDYDNIDVVQMSKQKLADHFLHNTTEISIKNHLHMKGFEPVQREIISTLVPTGTDDRDLLNYKYSSDTNKKQKCGDYGFSFNFDDLPMFESIDCILSAIRSTGASPESLQKLLSLDLSELVDHPLWDDILSTLSQVLSTPVEESVHTHVLCILQRFVVGFKGTSQGLDTTMHILRYLIHQWIQTDSIADQHSGKLGKQQLAVFCSLLQVAALSVQVPYQKDVERAVAAIFFILAKGELYLQSPGSSQFTKLTLMEALVFTDEQGDSLSSLLHFVHPSTVLTNATQTGLLGTLLQSYHVDLPMSGGSEQQRIGGIRTCTFRLRLLLVLLLHCGHNTTKVVGFLDEHTTTTTSPLVALVDLSKYEWKGDWQAFCTAPVQARDKKSDVLQPVDHTNKRFLHLTPCEPLPRIFEDAFTPAEQNQGSVIVACVAARLHELAALVRALEPSTTSTESTTAELLGMQVDIAVILLLSLKFAACVNPAVNGDGISSICKTYQEIAEFLLTPPSRIPADTWRFSDRHSLLGALIAGLHSMLSGEHGEAVVPFVRPLLQYLLSLPLLEPKNLSGGGGIVAGSLLRLLDCFTALAGPANLDTVSQIVALCTSLLETVIQDDFAPINNTRVIARLVQVLQTACMVPATLCTVLSYKDGQAVLQSMLRTLLMPQLLSQTGDSAARTVSSILTILSSWSQSATQHYFEGSSPVRKIMIQVLRTEYQDPGTFERAYDSEATAANGAFNVLFQLLVALVRAGHVNAVGSLLRDSWGEQVELSESNSLDDLAAFAVLVVRGSAQAVVYESECIYPYLLRLLYAAQHDEVFCAAVATAVATLPQEDISHLVADSEGVDLTRVFVRATLAMVERKVGKEHPEASLRQFVPASQDLLQLCS